MEGNQTKNIEKSLNALRVIKHTVYSKRFYPGNFDTDFWEEKDFWDSSFRESIRAEFERYIELYVELNNKYVIALQESATVLESEYNQIVVSSVNLEQALKHFREQYRAALFNIEQECDLNKILLRYLNPLKKHGIITMNESSGYQEGFGEHIDVTTNGESINRCTVAFGQEIKSPDDAKRIMDEIQRIEESC